MVASKIKTEKNVDFEDHCLAKQHSFAAGAHKVYVQLVWFCLIILRTAILHSL